MTINHIWSILCKRSLLDKETNNISIFDVIEQVSITPHYAEPNKRESFKTGKIITIPFEYELINLWERDKIGGVTEAEVIIDLYDPNNKLIQSIPSKLKFDANHRRMRVNNKVIGLIVTIPGIYRFKVKIKEKNQGGYRIASEIPLEININPSVSKN